jgi:chromosome segregation ATPase
LRELQDVQTTTTNERLTLEKKVRSAQDKSQALQEELEEKEVELSSAKRQHQHTYRDLESQYETLKNSAEGMRVELDTKKQELQTTQQKLKKKELEVGELESEVIKLRSHSGGPDELPIVKRELSEQIQRAKKLEAQAQAQQEDLKNYRKAQMSIKVLEEDKLSLQNQLKIMNDLRRQLDEAYIRKQALEDERMAWASYLENESSEDDLKFDTPEDLAKAYINQRIETASLLGQLGEIQPELMAKDEAISVLEAEKSNLKAELEKLRTSAPANAAPATTSSDSKARQRLERQRTLLTKEVENLRAQLQTFDAEEMEAGSATYDTGKTTRISELEKLVDEYRKDIQNLHEHVTELEQRLQTEAKVEVQQPIPSSPKKRPLEDPEENNDRIGSLARKNRALQTSYETAKKKISVLEADLKAARSQLKSLKDSSRTRILELKSNPTADFEALKMNTVRNLRKENADLLAQLQGGQDAENGASLVPASSLAASKDAIRDLATKIALHEKKIDRLKRIWTAKSLEFREAVASLLGYRMDFLPNGRFRVSSIYHSKSSGSLDDDDDNAEENSIVFDGENGTMKVSGGPRSAFANEIRDLITFWVDGRKTIPGFLAAMTLEFLERQYKDETIRMGGGGDGDTTMVG